MGRTCPMLFVFFFSTRWKNVIYISFFVGVVLLGPNQYQDGITTALSDTLDILLLITWSEWI